MEASAFRAPAALAPRRPIGVLLRLRTDEQLVALFRQGNEDAFRVIHDRYRQRLSAYARQMLGGSTTDADDAMQDVFLRAYGALRADGRPVTLRAWLYRVAHNRCIDHLRRPASQPTDELHEGNHTLAATTGDPIIAAEGREALRRLVADVRALPEQQRSALLMREMEGLTYVELAAALQVTVPAVKSLLVRARMGLVESQQARDTPCQEIREDITIAHDRGVRASGRARRHARECAGCAGFRVTLKDMSGDLGALNPSVGPWGTLLKLVGLGAGGSGAAGGAAAAGGGATVVSTGAAGAAGTLALGTGAATKLAVAVCCAAVFGGGVEAAREPVAPPAAAATRHAASASTTAAAAANGMAGGLTARALAPAERMLAAGRAALRRAAFAAPASRAAHHVAIASPIVVTAPDPSFLPPDALGSGADPAPADGGLEAPAEGQAAVAGTGDGLLPAAPGTSITGSGTTTGTGPTGGTGPSGTAPGSGTGTGTPSPGAGTPSGTVTLGSGGTGGGDAGPRSGDGSAGADGHPAPKP
jgi:RNA polymerase sigma factor (sigma-70 family)